MKYAPASIFNYTYLKILTRKIAPPKMVSTMPVARFSASALALFANLAATRAQRRVDIIQRINGSISGIPPELVAKLREWEIADVTYFHISDEPREMHLESFKAAKESLGNMLDGFHTFDALSSYEFYKHGLISKPIPGNNEIEEFLAHGLTDMWTYYCTGQFYEVSNRFMSMPFARNRIYGVQLYKYDIIGILHWGYNFYNSQHSFEHIDPYQVTDAGNAFPSGDPFLVYPGADGYPEESIRMMVHYEALTDLRALELLESLTGKEHVMELIEGELDEPLTFKRYPKSDMYLISLRNRVNREIAQLTEK